MTNQITNTILMVRPIAFYRNEQTAVNNYFQEHMPDVPLAEIQDHALNEFDLFANKLRDKGINVIIVKDTPGESTPDSIFPNNWVSFHDDGSVLLYPMFAENRRKERRNDIIEKLRQDYFVNQVLSLADWENKSMFLEGTGSLILDRPNKIAYAAISDRTHPEVLTEFGKLTGYSIVSFNAYQTFDNQRLPIYHTNVLMAIGDQFAVLCADSIDDVVERENVIFSLQKTGKEVIFITEDQVKNFAGNVLQVMNTQGNRFIVMSYAAFESFTDEQKQTLSQYGEILYSPIPTIETLGGGGVRCMMAEVFLPKQLLV